MFGPVVGNFFSSFLEFLYEQCSLHMTEKIPSSVKFGLRPGIFLIRSNSSGVRPGRFTTSSVTIGSAGGVLRLIDIFTLMNWSGSLNHAPVNSSNTAVVKSVKA